MACLIRATCHSFTSRYSWIATAARNARLRPVLLASFCSLVFAKAVEANREGLCVQGLQYSTKAIGPGYPQAKVAVQRSLTKNATVPSHHSPM
jgi:hypothetical protein